MINTVEILRLAQELHEIVTSISHSIYRHYGNSQIMETRIARMNFLHDFVAPENDGELRQLFDQWRAFYNEYKPSYDRYQNIKHRMIAELHNEG